jgi:hypothetical protein
MRKVSVTCQITYDYIVEVPEEELDDAVGYVDCEDPVYQKITRIFNDHNIDFNGEIISIMDDETEEFYYVS